MKSIFYSLAICLALTVFSGCATIRKIKNYDDCQEQVNLLSARLQEAQAIVVETEAQKEDELDRMKRQLSQKLGAELSEYKAKLERTERGLVITFMAEIFFKSGKADLLEDAKKSLKSVSDVLKKQALDSVIAVEGHTDNVPIKYSTWKSNWELAAARAVSVVHYFVDDCGLDPSRLQARSFGEHHPVADNAEAKGRQQNRRVEIVIVPPVKR